MSLDSGYTICQEYLEVNCILDCFLHINEIKNIIYIETNKKKEKKGYFSIQFNLSWTIHEKKVLPGLKSSDLHLQLV